MEIKELFNKPSIIGICSDSNQGKSNLLYHIIQTLKSNFEFWNKKLNYPTTFGICYKCSNGYMTKKKGKFGIFYGCSNYPTCNHIINIKEIDNEKD